MSHNCYLSQIERRCNCDIRRGVSVRKRVPRRYCRRHDLTPYSARESSAQHVLQADEAIALGSIGQDDGNPYLNIDLLVQIALSAQADAIHPGYGYLSENAGFADAVRNAGINFIGPSASAMSSLGDKRSAKAYLRQHGSSVPLIPGVTSSSQDPDELKKLAVEIGYPVMLKASAGGGGKGMRIVRDESQFSDELQRTQSEAARLFGSSDCILEKYIESGKHIEIQIFGDRHGNVVSLNERECSIQRRHQKVIEETPSPWLDAQKRQVMSQAAVEIGKLLSYENAGTVEFVFDVATGNFYFLEVNTRLQVEHPITEETTRLDLVALQLFVAAGGNLSTLTKLQPIQQIGHAIECRLCAEDPSRDFYPENGALRLWKPAVLASTDPGHVRFETGVATGSQVSIHFDSMIAKIVVWAPTRAHARAKMIRVLADTACIGVGTNQLFMQSCLVSDAFSDPGYTTSFIPKNISTLSVSPYAQTSTGLHSALPLLASYLVNALPQYLPQESYSRPFGRLRSKFRNQAFDPRNSSHHRTIVTLADSTAVVCSWATQQTSNSRIEGIAAPLPQAEASSKNASGIAVRYNALSNALKLDHMPGQREHSVSIISCHASEVSPDPASSSSAWITASLNVCLNGSTFRAELATERSSLAAASVTDVGQSIRIMFHVPQLGTWIGFNVYSLLSYFESLREAIGEAADSTRKVITAPMPCKVLEVLKKDGDQVKAGEKLLVIESMKMEISISSQMDGVFQARVQEQDAVDEGAPLCVVGQEEVDG
jgi:acetyl/propionyl-CoA carboxylase alpha subunit